MKPAFPIVRWLALAWLAVWAPAYWRFWGAANFLHVCDIAVVLTCIGLWTGDSLLLSSQAVGAIVPDVAWCLDAGSRLLFGRHLFGGTEYMWDPQMPLWVRLLSLFHVVLPVLLVWAVGRVGYDRRGWALQTGITAVLLGISRLFAASRNLNYAYVEPVFHRAWGPAPVHLFAVLAVMALLLYLPPHVVLLKTLPPPPGVRSDVPRE